FAAGARSDRRARRSIRHFDSAQRRAGDAYGIAGRRPGRPPRRGAVGTLMNALRTLPEALADAARSENGYCFVGANGEVVRPYADIERTALSLARSLVEAGVRRGDCVALVLPDPESFLIALLGVSISGAIPASVHAPATMGDLPHYYELTSAVLRSCEARAVITTAALVAGFEVLRAS